MDEDDGVAPKDFFAWESGAAQSWEFLQEDEDGTLKSSINELQRKNYLARRRFIANKSIRRGILRHLFVVLDMSKASNDADLAPNRGKYFLTMLKVFTKEYFEQNPLSQLGVVMVRDGVVERLLDLSGNLKESLLAIPDEIIPKGEYSLKNALEVVKSMLMHVPGHGTKEILLMLSSNSTCDVGDLEQTISSLKTARIKVSTVSVSTEVFIIKKVCKDTFGEYSVSINEDHYKSLLFQYITPPAIRSSESKPLSYLIQMGFPLKLEAENVGSLCSCHGKPICGGFECPQCKGKVCQVPIECPICRLTLVTSPQLVKSYPHMFPVSQYLEGANVMADALDSCFGCKQHLGGKQEGGKLFSRCPDCKHLFCSDCDNFVHDQLFNCPGCINSR